MIFHSGVYDPMTYENWIPTVTQYAPEWHQIYGDRTERIVTMTDKNALNNEDPIIEAAKTEAGAIMTLARAIADASHRQHLDKMVSDNEAWHCPVCDQYFTYFQQIPVAVDIVIGQQHFVCHECYAKMNETKWTDD